MEHPTPFDAGHQQIVCDHQIVHFVRFRERRKCLGKADEKGKTKGVIYGL